MGYIGLEARGSFSSLGEVGMRVSAPTSVHGESNESMAIIEIAKVASIIIE